MTSLDWLLIIILIWLLKVLFTTLKILKKEIEKELVAFNINFIVGLLILIAL